MTSINLDKQDSWREKTPFFKQFDKELDTTFSTPEFERQVMNADRVNASDDFTKEVAARMHEENVNANRQYRWQNQEELDHERLGKVVWCIDFLNDLNKIIPARYVGVSKYGLMNLQALVPTMDGGEWQFVCGQQIGYNAEYSTFYFDSHGLPTSEMYRGWRTVLLRLITGGFIKERDAHKVFGEATGPESKRYKEQLKFYRNFTHDC